MQTTRRSFFTGLLAASGVTLAARVRAGVSARHDPNLAVFISDLHLNGLKDEVPTHLYEEQCFQQAVRRSSR